MTIEDIDGILDCGGDDTGATCCAEHGEDTAIGMRSDQRSDRRERSFTRADIVCGRRDVAEFVTDTRNREICTDFRCRVKQGKGCLIPFISLFIITPVSGTMTREPKNRLIVVVSENARPEASAIATWDVPCLTLMVIFRKSITFSRCDSLTNHGFQSHPDCRQIH